MEMLTRWFGGVILLVFAFAPAWILFHSIVSLIRQPSGLDGATAIIIVVCAGLLYFLLLVAFRAFTGKGRKGDGGLLPPWGLQVFAVAWGAVGIGVVAMGIIEKAPAPVFFGAGYVATAVALFMLAQRRRRKANSDAEIE